MHCGWRFPDAEKHWFHLQFCAKHACEAEQRDHAPGGQHPRTRLEEIDPEDDLDQSGDQVQPLGCGEFRWNDRHEELG